MYANQQLQNWIRGSARPIATLILVGALSLPASESSAATAVDYLQRFFSEITTFGANFDQVVLDEDLQIVEETNGQMWITRPGKFRWDYAKPAEQRIIGDGERIWIYDKDLEQVTVRGQDATVGRTPAILLAGSGNIEDSYDIEDMGPQGETTWVALKPKDVDSQFESVRIGFSNDGYLKTMELVDGFGQTTRITLHEAEENKALDPQLFAFVPPEGVDVIDESN